MIKTEISPEDLAEIEKICRARTESYQVVTRAKTLKLRYEGKTIERIETYFFILTCSTNDELSIIIN